MQWIVMSMKWIMLVSGALTCTMLYAAIAPQAALQGTFGQTLHGRGGQRCDSGVAVHRLSSGVREERQDIRPARADASVIS